MKKCDSVYPGFTLVWEGRVEMTHRSAEVRFPPWSRGALSCPQFYRVATRLLAACQTPKADSSA